MTKDTNLLVWKRECAKGPVDGVERYNRSVKVSEYLCIHQTFYFAVQLLLAWPNTLALDAQLTTMLDCLGFIQIHAAHVI